MEDLKFYEVSDEYVDYIKQFDNKIAFNKLLERRFKRKYIGILIKIADKNYIAPMSSFKEKHKHMPDNIDFIKVDMYSVINLNNMFPVPMTELSTVDISSVEDINYRNLLMKEYISCKPKFERIVYNARTLYDIIINNKNQKLKHRCCDFELLEIKCQEYKCNKRGV